MGRMLGLLTLGVPLRRGASAGGFPVFPISDLFTDTNGKALDAHRMDDGSGWLIHSGDADIQSNALNVTAAPLTTGSFTASTNAGEADVTAEADIILPAVPGSTYHGLALRVEDEDNAWWVSVLDVANEFRIAEVAAGVITSRASASVTIDASTTYRIRATAGADWIAATLDGANLIKYGSASGGNDRGRHGFRMGAVGVGADDFSVSDPIFLEDEFADANSTAIADHDMDVGTGWTANSGAADIQNNRLNAVTAAATTASCTVTADAGAADGTVAADIIAGSSGTYYAVAARVQDGDNAWWIGVIPVSNLFRIAEVVAGVITSRASASKTITNGVTYRVAAVLDGTTISATVDGGTPLSYGSASVGATRTLHGFRFGQTGERADNFEFIA